MGKGFLGILNIDNAFLSFAKKLLYVFILNFLFIFTSIPIITAGASYTAMNGVFNKIINEGSFSVFKDYFTFFGRNFIKSTVIWLGCLVTGILLYIDIFYWYKYGDGALGYVFLGISIIAAVFYIMVMLCGFSLVNRFEMGIIEYIKTAAQISIKHILLSFEAVFITVLILAITVFALTMNYLFIILYIVIMCFGLIGFINSYIYRAILNPYSEEYVEMAKRIREELRKEEEMMDDEY